MGISVWQLVILLAVVLLIFGTKKLKNVGGDLGSAIKSFKTAVKDGDVDKDGNKDKQQHKVAHNSKLKTNADSIKESKV